MLKNDNFVWASETKDAFELLKKTMSEVLVLGLPNFDKTFVVETDASGVGIGVVLIQEGRPLAFISQALAPRHVGLNIYEKELLAVIFVVDKWQYYLEERRFIIKTDHESLKFLLQQKLLTYLQMLKIVLS